MGGRKKAQGGQKGGDVGGDDEMAQQRISLRMGHNYISIGKAMGRLGHREHPLFRDPKAVVHRTTPRIWSVCRPQNFHCVIHLVGKAVSRPLAPDAIDDP